MRSPWAAFWLLALCTGCEVSFHDEPALEPDESGRLVRCHYPLTVDRRKEGV